MARVVDLLHQPHCILMPRRAIQQSHRRLRLDIELLQVVDLPTEIYQTEQKGVTFVYSISVLELEMSAFLMGKPQKSLNHVWF